MDQNEKEQKDISGEIRKFGQVCLEHAEDLLASARLVFEGGRYNIAFHLAALALEEIGKRELYIINLLAAKRGEVQSWPRKHMEDHVQKLFWSFFTVDFGNKGLHKTDFDMMKELATGVHQTRLAGLYVSAEKEDLLIPGEAVSREQAEQLLGMAEARIGLVEVQKPRIPSQKEIELQEWFLKICEDKDWRRYVFSEKSMAKFTELADAKDWVLWLKEIYDQHEAENRALAEAEIAKAQKGESGEGKERWRVRVRLSSDSHTIRPKELRTWNEKVEWIKLSPVTNKKNELFVDFTLLDHVNVDRLYWLGWGLARHFAVALNIATMGFFWWDRSRKVEQFYEKITDLENKSEIRVERTPSLKIDWGGNRVLTDEDLWRAVQCFAALPRPNEIERQEPFGYYIGGLTFLGINDIHWQCEHHIFGNFYKSMQAMMVANGDWEKGQPFDKPFGDFLRKTWPELGEDVQRYMEIGHGIDTQASDEVKITLKDAVDMKLFTDAYFMIKYREKHMPDIGKEEK